MIANEIGGYLGLEEFSGREYYPGLVKLNSARNALLYLLKSRRIQKLYIPRYLCDTVSALCDRYGYTYEYYNIGPDFLPVFDTPLGADEWLYVVNYYGQLSNDTICRLQQKHRQIIVDNVQAFFQPPVAHIDTLYSCRKFFGVPDGAYLATDALLDEALPVDISKDRMTHILGRYECTGSEYYGAFQANDEGFYSLELRQMSALTQNILRAVDYESVRLRRNANYRVLEEALASRNALQLTAPDGAYCYPFYCQNGAALRKQLAAQKIYVPTLWPNVTDIGNALERDYAENILPLPCDQRYSEQDMQHLVKVLLSLLEAST